MRYPKRRGRLSVPGRRLQLATAALLLATTVAACGGEDDDAKAGAPKAPATIPTLTNDPLTLSFIWFEWPPAQALEDFANAEYKKVRPNVTVKVNTVPNANWHDAMFTQFAARKTDFDIAILDSQHIGEAVTNGNILDLTDFVKQNIDVNAYDPYLLAAYGQFPQAETGKRDENASLYGLPLLGDTWTMIYRKDLIGDTPPQTWDQMISVAAKCQADNPGVSGLAFHQANGSDAAAVTYNTVNGVYGGNLWNAKDRKIDGVLNDAAGQEAMDVLVNKMKPLTAKGSGNWFIDEVNASVAQGKACIAFQWIAASGGLLDPKQSTLGTSREQILGKLGFATLPTQKTNLVPLGGMGMHVSAYAAKSNQAEALNFMKWFEQADIQKKWAAAGGVPSRTDALQSPEFLNASPFNKVYADSVPRMRDMWNVPEYAQLVNIENTNVNAALKRREEPEAGARRHRQAAAGRAGLQPPQGWRRAVSAPVPPKADRPGQVASAPPPAPGRSRRSSDRRIAVAFTSPALLLLLAMSVFPLLWTLYLSFTDYSATRGGPAEFVWFGNYTAILTSAQVHQRTLTTLVFVVGAVTLQTVLGFAIAYLISRRTRGRGLLTTVFLVPMMLSPVVVGLFWRFMLDAQFGVVNSMLDSIGLGQVEWLTRQRTALLSLIVVDTWQWTPFIMLIALAGLTAVPKYLYEAASIDRASEWFKFRTITLPLVWPLLLIAVLFRAIEAFRQFDLVYILTSGGPGVSTETLSFHVYKVAFLGFNTGTASAYGILMVLVVIVLTQFYLRYLNKLKED